MSIKVLLTYNYSKEQIQKLEDLGCQVIVRDEKELRYSEQFEDVEVLITYNPFKTLDITKMRRLKWIQLLSNGYDHVPMDYINQQNIILTNNKDSYTRAVAEWTVAKVLEISKNTHQFYEKQKRKNWQLDQSVMEIANKTVTIIGTGKIAVETAKRLKAFEAKLIGVNRTGREVKIFDYCYSIDKLNKAIIQSDVVIVLLPANEQTYHIIDEKVFEMMKEQVIFINVSRGSVVDEDAMIKYLKLGKFRGVALDVFEQEPLAKENILWKLKNTYVTPHNAFLCETTYDRILELLITNMKKYKFNEELIGIVNKYSFN